MAAKSTYPDVVIPENVSWPAFIMQNFDKYGDKTALIDSTTQTSYTYTQLKTLVTKTTSALNRQGLGIGTVFAFILPNIPEFFIALYSITSLGAVVTALNPISTVHEMATQLRDSAAKYILTTPEQAGKARDAAEVVGITSLYCIGAAEGFRDFNSLLQDDGSCVRDWALDSRETIATLPYSSGTTGLPKGVMQTHYNGIADMCMLSADDFLGFDENAVVLGLLPFFHVYGMMLITANALYSGSTLVCMCRFKPEVFLQVIQHYKVSVANIAPPLVLFLAQSPLVDMYDISSLTHVTSGAAGLAASVEEALLRRLPMITSFKLDYGMSEALGIAFNPVSRTKPRSVGLLLPNVEAKIIDIVTKDCLSLGMDGEICIRSPTVMKGYLNNPEATTHTVDSEGWLYTGDIGHLDPDGYLYIVDRMKELVKYKGYQVPPAELEAVLLTHPSIVDAAVVGVPDLEAGQLPKAFIVTDDRGLDPSEVAQYVAERVAPYKKLRGGVEVIDAIPKSASGKMLRRILQQREIDRIDK